MSARTHVTALCAVEELGEAMADLIVQGPEQLGLLVAPTMQAAIRRLDAARPNVAFAGLTAAGKTTHARLLADQLGYTYMSATEVLLSILGIDAPGDGVWFDRYGQIQAARAGGAADDELDRRLAVSAAEREGTVFDTWALAWVSPSPLLRVWIESDEDSRTRKCLVSQPIARLSLVDCRALVGAKDADARAGFLRRHGFDLFTDRARYDLILSNSHLIPHADRGCADAGIEAFAPVVRAAVTALLAGRPEPELTVLAQRHSREILRIHPWNAPGLSSDGGVSPSASCR